MKKRSALAVFIFGFITLGFYSWYWEVKTKGEMNQHGQHIPTAWIWLIPFVGYLWWAWKYSEGVGNVTNNEAPAVLVFLLMLFTGPVGDGVIQHYFNGVSGEATPANATPAATVPAETSAPAPSSEPADPAPTAPPTDSTGPEIPPVTDTPPEQTPPQPPAGPLVQ